MALTTLRLHRFTDIIPANWGDTSADFRGSHFIGDPVDGHQTLFEYNFDDASLDGQVLVQSILAEAPQMNVLQQGWVSKAEATVPGGVGSQLGNLRWGLWDKTPHATG